MKYKVNKLAQTLLLIVLIVLVFWFTRAVEVRLGGIAHIANNQKEYTDSTGHMIQGEYSISINLGNLESNIGKELYNDGANKIYIDWIDNTGSLSTGGYRIGFRSTGKYSHAKATLVSGVQHAVVNKSSFTNYMSAKMIANYNGKTYNSPTCVVGGINYRDGDEFAFYIFPNEAYKNGETSLEEKGKVEVKVTNLFKNIWTKR